MLNFGKKFVFLGNSVDETKIIVFVSFEIKMGVCSILESNLNFCNVPYSKLEFSQISKRKLVLRR